MHTLNWCRGLHRAAGWVVFGVTLGVYLLTTERTAGYWDCGEFVLSSHKLQVPHAPGAPFYLLLGRLFAMLAAAPEQVAFFVNVLSAVASALTVLFLFWTLSLLVRRMIETSFRDLSSTRTYLLATASGVIGALSYAFSDTFWSSATEAEVYALSSLMVSVIVWAALKWEASSVSLRDRWVLFIAYILGLSLGVHLLALLTIPALCFFLYYDGKNTLNFWISTGLCAVGGIIIFLILWAITQGIPGGALALDVYFVNTLSLPFNSGAVFFVLLLTGGMLFSILYTRKKGHARLNLILLAVRFLLIGYASYVLILIRAAQDPPINENSPKTLPRFLSYLKREQYGDRPLFYGRNYTADPIGQETQAPIYARKKDSPRYEIVGYEQRTVYEEGHTTFFPRLYSEDHAEQYARILPNLREKPKPDFLDNVSFFLKYQVEHMYLRYFLWNFSGRAGHKQGSGWLSAADALQAVPAIMQKDPARNRYFMLPLLLGLMGLFFHCLYDVKRFTFVLLLFVFMGIGLAVYLNMPPFEPRERDYIYAGSFYAFAIWIGLSFSTLLLSLPRKIPWRTSFGVLSVVGLSSVLLLCTENWDDHDRSKRYFSTESAKNVLAACAPNAVLFTGGDNDTFPLWYAQEVEGFRTDVRVIVFSYFNSDWYIEQMMQPVYESPPVPFSLSLTHYEQGGDNDFIPVYDLSPTEVDEADYHKEYAVDLSTYLSMVRARDDVLRLTLGRQEFNYMPGRWLVWADGETHAAAQSTLPARHQAFAVEELKMRIKTDYLEKKDLAILDFIHTNAWKRPIYFNHTSLKNFAVDIRNHVVQEGLLFRLLPIEDRRDQETKELFGDFLVNTEQAYRSLMRASFRGLDDPSIHYPDNYKRFVFSYRSAFLSLANALIAADEPTRAKEVIAHCLRALPDKGVPYDILHNLEVISLLLTLEEPEKATQMADVLSKRAGEMLDYVLALRGDQILAHAEQFYESRYALTELGEIFSFHENPEQAERYRALLKKYDLTPADP